MINLFKKSYSEKEINFFRFLGRMALFEKLTYEEMSLFLPFFYLREYKSDEVVFFRNDPSNALYLVKSGKVSLCVDVNDNFETLRNIKSGGEFGENSLLPSSNRILNAIVASERAELYVLPKINIEGILGSHAKINSKMMQSLAEVYNDLNRLVFKGYTSSAGLFNLSQIYGN